MIDLESQSWSELRAAGGGTGTLAVSLLRRLYDGDDSVLSELFEQSCHQFTPSEVGYATVPHLMRLVRLRPETAFRLEALRIIGSVVAGRDASPTSSPPIPTSLQSDFEAALAEAMGIATKLIATEQLTPGKSMECLAVIAALRKNTNLAMHIFLSGGAELSCPTCGEPIDFVEKA